MQILSGQTGQIGTNTYLVYDETTNKGFIVDPGGYSAAFTSKAKELGLDIEYIMLTHGHADHIMGIPRFKEDFPKAKILACINEKEMLGDVSLNMSAQFGNRTTVEADIFVDDNDTLSVGNMELKFFTTPGHTPGGMCIYCAAANVLFSGDTLFYRSIGRTDFPGSSYPEIVKSIKEKILVLPAETAVYPGHMNPTTVGFEKENNPFV